MFSRVSDDRQTPVKKLWQRPAVVSHALPEPTLLLACSANHPVDCYPHTKIHYCVARGCRCTGVPGTC